MLVSLLFRHLFMRSLSLRLAFMFAGGSQRPFYTLRNHILLLDFILSYGIRVLLALAGVRIVFLWHRQLSPYLDIGLSGFLLLSLALIRLEREGHQQQWLRPFSIDNVNVGSARILQGQVLIGHLFLATSRRLWNQDEIHEVLTRVNEATGWIEKQAVNYKLEVKITHWVFPEPYGALDVPVPEHRNHYKFKSEFEQALRPAMIAVRQQARESGSANTCMMVHVLDEIRSYAVPVYIGRYDAAQDGLEYCVCGKDDNSAAYAHEILHLFGADDYYAEHYKKLQEYRGELFRRSIMFATKSLDGVRVDELTAQNIGWL